jgi:hypothetical protein
MPLLLWRTCSRVTITPPKLVQSPTFATLIWSKLGLVSHNTAFQGYQDHSTHQHLLLTHQKHMVQNFIHFLVASLAATDFCSCLCCAEATSYACLACTRTHRHHQQQQQHTVATPVRAANVLAEHANCNLPIALIPTLLKPWIGMPPHTVVATIITTDTTHRHHLCRMLLPVHVQKALPCADSIHVCPAVIVSTCSDLPPPKSSHHCAHLSQP